MPQYTGIVRIKLNGDLLETLPGKSLNLGGKTRTDVRPDTGIGGFHETTAPAEIECKVAHRSGTPTEALNALVGATLEFETDTGITFLVPNAYCSEPVQLSDQGEGLTVKFMGDPAKEV